MGKKLKALKRPQVLTFTQEDWGEISMMVKFLVIKMKLLKEQTEEPNEILLLNIMAASLQEIDKKINERPLRAFPLTPSGQRKMFSLSLTDLQEYILMNAMSGHEFSQYIHETLGVVIVDVLHHKQINKNG